MDLQTIVFANGDVTPLIGPPYWNTAKWFLIIYRKLSVICIFKKNTEYNVKNSENYVKHSDFNTGEMDKSREL